MLNFDSCGFLVPDRNISSTISELEQTFKITTTREDIYENYLNYSKNLKEVVDQEIKQWVDESFVTKKPVLNDIDIISFIDYNDYEKHKN